MWGPQTLRRKTKAGLLAGFCVSVAAMGLGHASADAPRRWLVVGIATGRSQSLSSILHRTVEALQIKKQPVWEDKAARAHVQRRVSRPFPAITEPQIREWRARMDEIIEDLMAAKYGDALEKLDDEAPFLQRATPALLTNPTQRKLAVASCLFRVRAQLGTGNRPGAVADAGRCVKLVPRRQLDPLWHPPDVRALFGEVRHKLPQGQLVVTADRGCHVLIAGIPAGLAHQPNALPYGSYDVLARCADGRLSRVHTARVGATPRSVGIRMDLDAILHTDADLRLGYTRDISPALRREHALLIADKTEAGGVVLVSVHGSAVRLQLHQADHDPTEVWLPKRGRSKALMTRAISALQDNRNLDLRAKKRNKTRKRSDPDTGQLKDPFKDQ